LNSCLLGRCSTTWATLPILFFSLSWTEWYITCFASLKLWVQTLILPKKKSPELSMVAWTCNPNT
jgi:hypothetical protein